LACCALRLRHPKALSKVDVADAFRQLRIHPFFLLRVSKIAGQAGGRYNASYVVLRARTSSSTASGWL
jgi:hypothetical protein